MTARQTADTEIKKLISQIPKFSIKVVTTLPADVIYTSTVYLVTSGDDSNNLYNEYIFIVDPGAPTSGTDDEGRDYYDSNGGEWELLGQQEVDLSEYAKKSEIPKKTSQLENDSKFLTAVPSEYVTETELSNKAETWTFTLEDGNTVTKKVVLA